MTVKTTVLSIMEAAKKKKEKPVDPNEEAKKLRGLTHSVGHIVHAGLAVKGGAGYRGEVVKIDNEHTYIKIGKNRVVKAPHRLVSAHEEYVAEESKEERKERLKREAAHETRSERKYKETENKIEGREERSKRRHERARRLHQEETIYDHDTGKEREVSHYHIISRKDGSIVGKAKTKKSARSVVDKRDNAYGSYNHYSKPVFKEETNIVPSKMTRLQRLIQIKSKIIDEAN